MVMMKKRWHGILKIEEIVHKDIDGTVLWEEKNLTNILHNTGEALLLKTAFAGGLLPSNYFFGLDSRTILTVNGGTSGESIIYPYIQDNIIVASKPQGEPTTGVGYTRVNVANNVFTVSLDEDLHYRASGPIVSFLGSGVGWGPVTNFFIGYVIDSQEIILATVPLTQSVTVTNGQVINARVALKLILC
jgi:hypothetical protein